MPPTTTGAACRARMAPLGSSGQICGRRLLSTRLSPLRAALCAPTARLREERGIGGVGVGHTGASSRVEKWSSAYHWVERAAAWDAELARTRREVLREEIAEMNRRHAIRAAEGIEALVQAPQALLAKIAAEEGELTAELELESTARLIELAAQCARGHAPADAGRAPRPWTLDGGDHDGRAGRSPQAGWIRSRLRTTTRLTCGKR